MVKSKNKKEPDKKPIKRIETLQKLVRKLEAALSKKNKFNEEVYILSRAVQHSPSTVVITDKNGNLEYVNPKFTELTGYALKEVKGKNLRVLKAGDQPPEVYKELWEVIISGKEWRGEFHNKMKNGGLYWEMASISPITNSKGEITHFVEVAEDITERKNAMTALKDAKDELEVQAWGLKKANEGIKLLYKELEQKNKELQKIDKLKSDFVSTVSHELRTPLSIIKEGLALTLDEVLGKINEKQKNVLSMSKENVDRLARIINDLLDISKIEAGKIELKRALVDFAAMMRDMCIRWKSEFDKKGQELKVLVPDEQVNMYIDADKIAQVMNNLISNAIKYTPEKGKIIIELKDKKDEVEISVSDTGVGIAKEDLPRVFNKFQQFNRAAGAGAKGTGLGLSIVKQLVELHKGTVMVESEVNKGSEFTFNLPKMEVESVFREYLNNKIKETSEKNIPLSVVIIRIKDFDKLQKGLGCDKFHSLLKGIEKVVAGSLRRQADTVLRDTGELMVFLVDTSKENVKVVRDRIEKAINAYLSENKKEWFGKIRVLLGNATYPDDAITDEALLHKARTGIPGKGKRELKNKKSR